MAKMEEKGPRIKEKGKTVSEVHRLTPEGFSRLFSFWYRPFVDSEICVGQVANRESYLTTTEKLLPLSFLLLPYYLCLSPVYFFANKVCIFIPDCGNRLHTFVNPIWLLYDPHPAKNKKPSWIQQVIWKIKKISVLVLLLPIYILIYIHCCCMNSPREE